MTKHLIYNPIHLLILSSILSCTSAQKIKDQEFVNDKVYPAIACFQDTSITYSLYLPPQYDHKKPCPVFILFDPHGDGLLPVNLFSSRAAKSGFILAGSNNSKNGMFVEKTNSIYEKILADLSGRFNIEKKAIYLGGFSGGSRVAGAAAISEGNVAGVVGCGAGLPNTSQKPVKKFSYLAVVGNQDFNLAEMKQLDESLEQASYEHYLLVFDGIHQWPPEEVIPEIFTWLRFDAMRQQAIPPDRAEIDAFIEKTDKEATAKAREGKPYQQQEIYIMMLHYLQGLTDVSPLQSEIGRLSDDKDVAAFREKQNQILIIEQDLQRKYAPEIQQKSLEWWTHETRKLHSLSLKPGDKEMGSVYKRVLGYLSLNSYMYSTDALKRGKLSEAEKYIDIYRLVDPSNSEHRYLAAKVAALNNKPDELFEALNQAFDLGFRDIKRLRTDLDFEPYRQDIRFKRLAAQAI